LFTWNYADHDLACLGDFPDSRTFYSIPVQKPKHISSILYLSTCNRIEIYVETLHQKQALNLQDILDLFKDTPVYKGIKDHTPVYKRGLDSVRHLFQVAAGLKSMALGETQITGQLKRDFSKAQEMGYVSSFFNSLIQKVFECQKKIRTQTDIGRNPVSLVSLLEKEMVSINHDQPLNLDRVAIGGTGDMSEKVVRYFLNKKVNRFVILRNDASRDLPETFKTMLDNEKVKKPGLDIEIINWSNLLEKDSNTFDRSRYDFSVFVTSTHAEHPLLNLEKIDILKKNGFLKENAIVADLGIPCNVDAEGVDIEKHNIVNLDRLLKQSKINKNLRGLHYREALPIIEKSIHVFWMDYLYSKNPALVNTVLKQVEKESQEEWTSLLSGPLKNITEKQKRILIDYMKKQERKALRTHKELFVDMLTIGEEEAMLLN